MSGKLISPTTRARIIALLAKQLPYEAIAQRTDVSEASVKRIAAEQRRMARLREVIAS